MFEFIIAIFAAFYVLQVMLYEDRISHFGPFKSTEKFIHNSQTYHTQPVALFDYIRRFTVIFNPYEIHGDLWEIIPHKMERWTCPKCLSFWTTFCITGPMFIHSAVRGVPINFLEYIFFHLAVAGASTLLSEVYDGLLRKKESEDDSPDES
jgi:hypothetical protein